MIERIVKGSDTDVKSDKLTAEDKPKVSKMKECFDTIKTEKKIGVELLRTFLAEIKQLVKCPDNLVKMSVHGRLIVRADAGEYKQLIDKKEGRMNRPTGENHGYADRRGGRGRGRPGYNDDRHGDRNNRGGRGGAGRGDGRGGFNTGQNLVEPVYDDKWRQEKDELMAKMNTLASQNIEQARAEKSDG